MISTRYRVIRMGFSIIAIIIIFITLLILKINNNNFIGENQLTQLITSLSK